MRALKLKGKVNKSGQLIVTEAIDLMPGEVEVIVLRDSALADGNRAELVSPLANKPSNADSFEAFMDWLLDGMSSVPSNVNADAAKWEYLKEKHNL